MNISKVSELQQEEGIMAMEALCECWDSDDNIPYGEMADQLELLIEVVDQKLTFAEFVTESQITNLNFIN